MVLFLLQKLLSVCIEEIFVIYTVYLYIIIYGETHLRAPSPACMHLKEKLGMRTVPGGPRFTLTGNAERLRFLGIGQGLTLTMAHRTHVVTSF